MPGNPGFRIRSGWCHSGDNLMLHKALLNTQDNVNSLGFGELIATSTRKAGTRAAIVDGTVRDAEEVNQPKREIENGVFLRTEIDEALRRLKIIE